MLSTWVSQRQTQGERERTKGGGCPGDLLLDREGGGGVAGDLLQEREVLVTCCQRERARWPLTGYKRGWSIIYFYFYFILITGCCRYSTLCPCLKNLSWIWAIAVPVKAQARVCFSGLRWNSWSVSAKGPGEEVFVCVGAWQWARGSKWVWWWCCICPWTVRHNYLYRPFRTILATVKKSNIYASQEVCVSVRSKQVCVCKGSKWVLASERVYRYLK